MQTTTMPKTCMILPIPRSIPSVFLTLILSRARSTTSNRLLPSFKRFRISTRRTLAARSSLSDLSFLLLANRSPNRPLTLAWWMTEKLLRSPLTRSKLSVTRSTLSVSLTAALCATGLPLLPLEWSLVTTWHGTVLKHLHALGNPLDSRASMSLSPPGGKLSSLRALCNACRNVPIRLHRNVTFDFTVVDLPTVAIPGVPMTVALDAPMVRLIASPSTRKMARNTSHLRLIQLSSSSETLPRSHLLLPTRHVPTTNRSRTLVQMCSLR